MPASAPAATDSEERALLAAIAAAPDDDGPRLVLADLLTSRGDPRGELIVLQCRLAALGRDPESGSDEEKQAKRVEAMLRAGIKAYAGELEPYVQYQDDFERGFVATVRMTIAAFAKHGMRLFTEYPLHTLVVVNKKWSEQDLGKLANAPALARVKRLVLSHAYTTPTSDPLAPLAKSPHLGQLNELVLMSCGHSSADWKKFFEKLAAPKLAKLQLAHNKTSASIQAAIAKNPALANLREYAEYVYKELNPKSTAKRRTSAAYAQLAETVALEKLTVEQADLVGDGALAPFFEASTAASLRRLELSMTSATNELLHAIARSPKASKLEELVLHDDGSFSLEGLRVILQSPRATALRRLAITSVGWDDRDRAAYHRLLLDLPKTHPLKSVGLPGREDGSAELQQRFVVDN